ncbi:MAG: MBOAT family protein [Ruminococcaceae bacterium]|nr:MBOAT family protein [Oscillospiraceae bacterium]
MVFSGIPFLYFFLPPLLGLYFLIPGKFSWGIRVKNLLLLVFSLVFYAAGEPKYIWLMLGSILAAYVFALLIDRVSKGRGILLAVSIGISLIPLLFYKYAGFFTENINAIFGTSIPVLRLSLPIGISFYTFQLVSYLADVYRRRVPAQKNPLSLALYVSFFPQLIAGPIVRYSDINEMLDHRTHSFEDFSAGAWRFTMGLAKKILLANTLGELCDLYRNSADQTMLFTWIYAIAICCQIYFDFSGYSDMAIGLGRIFGFHFIENFNYPYMSKGPAEFWRRWHISLGSWFRDYVYIPMGGNRVSLSRWMFNILTVWFLTGFWHGAGWTFIGWGLYFAVFLVAEKFAKPVIDKTPDAVRRVVTLFIVMISFILFDAANITEFARNVGNLFNFGNLVNAETLYYLRSYAVLLVLAVIGCTDFPKRGAKWLAEKSPAAAVIQAAVPAVMTVLLLVCTAYLVDGSFNPFLYFRF